MFYKKNHSKRVHKYLLWPLLAGMTLSVAGCAIGEGKDPVTIKDFTVQVNGYEYGPSVDKIIIELNRPVQLSQVNVQQLQVTTNNIARQRNAMYLSNEQGKPLAESQQEGRFLTIGLEAPFSTETFSGLASPFVFDFQTFMNKWATSYPVSIQQLEIEGQQLSVEGDSIDKKVMPEVAEFTNQQVFSGSYKNPLTGNMDSLSLHYAAYEPEKLKNGEKNPLVIWLHGQGEGGTNTEITLLGNEVTSLVREDIQKEFKAGKQEGAYVLAVQTPTYWMDEGDGTNGVGAGVSRYTEILMDTIKAYVASNPDIDLNRIYLAGCSNGGYMTLNMAVQYSDYFAALVPNAAAYAYYAYERNEDGTYKKVKDEATGFEMPIQTDSIWFDQEKVNRVKDIPMWFVHASNDTTVVPANYALPVYKALVDSGATNKWFSYYESVVGNDVPNQEYMGHWSWIYFFNNQVKGVQDVEKVMTNTDLSGFVADNQHDGGTQKAQMGAQQYNNVFQWLNAQVKP